jgi:hypothetical protein
LYEYPEKLQSAVVLRLRSGVFATVDCLRFLVTVYKKAKTKRCVHTALS